MRAILSGHDYLLGHGARLRATSGAHALGGLLGGGTTRRADSRRFQTPDRDIVISGDAAPPSSIPEQFHGCDILVHEGGFFHRDSAGPYQRSFHTSMEDMVDIVPTSRPKLLVLYHQPPGDNEAGLEYIRSHYDGRVVVAKDLDVFR